MTRTLARSKWTVCFACCCTLAGYAPAWQAKQPEAFRRLYVEPFVAGAGAEKLRADVIAELRKIGSVSLVPSESSADAALGGGGEIWIKGYSGFLSVELRDREGETLWSYLATPGSATEDVARTLAKRIAKQVAAAVELVVAPSRANPTAQPATILKGAGATFPHPVYSKWIANYRRVNPAVQLTYDAAGSAEGVRRLLAGAVDFGASDSPEAIREIASGEENKYLLLPSVVGAVVPIVNLPGVAAAINFTPEALAGIYLGKIRKWNDPVLKQANRGLRLPDLDIVVVHRSDGSGTSYAWTDYLSKVSPEWKAQVGSGLTPKWPAGRSAEGNDGVAKLVKELGGPIGYVEFIYALQGHLSFGRVHNRSGAFVEASLESIEIAASRAAEMGADFKVSLVDAPGAGAYPIASFTWLIVPARIADEARRGAITGFLKWMLGPGQRQAAALGYLALPKEVVTKEEDAILGIH